MVKSVGLLTIQVFIIQVNASNSIATLQPMVFRLRFVNQMRWY